MRQKKLIWQLFPSYLLITLAALIVLTFYTVHAFRQLYLEQVESELHRLAQIVRQRVAVDGKLLNEEEVEQLCKTFAGISESGMRITVVLANGLVIGDSAEDIRNMENHANRPEIVAALATGYGEQTRKSQTLGINMKYVAIPILADQAPLGVVRASVPVTRLEDVISRMIEKTVLCAFVVAICLAFISLMVSRGVTKPIVAMQAAAQRFSEGKLTSRIPLVSTAELRSLAVALNTMAQQLDERIRMVTSQRNELEAILSSMIEGVIAVDRTGHVVNVNKAASLLLNIDPHRVLGLNIEEVVRDVELVELVRTTLGGEQAHEGSLSLPVDGGRFFQVHGARLPDDQNRPGGAVIVLNDMTRIHRLEGVRRDFVANVSHELKTPVTSIKGFVEALIDTGLDDTDRANRYLEIVAKHADRLNAIIDDLLILSRLEEDVDNREITFDLTSLREVAQSSIELSALKAADKSVHVKLECDQDIQANINAPLLEQALVNLIDNAVKYSNPDSEVIVQVKQKDQTPLIAVADSGCGIPESHQERLFERFYVVDKGRTRKLGGTGLGLAIVKHIVQVHSGQVTVQSQVGVGSTFTIHLPAWP